MNGNASTIKTALAMVSAATVTTSEDAIGIPVPVSIRCRISTMMCNATKKKIVGGMSSAISFLTSETNLLMALPGSALDVNNSGIELHRLLAGAKALLHEAVDLAAPQLGVAAVLLQQLGVSAVFQDSSFFDEQYAVHVA